MPGGLNAGVIPRNTDSSCRDIPLSLEFKCQAHTYI